MAKDEQVDELRDDIEKISALIALVLAELLSSHGARRIVQLRRLSQLTLRARATVHEWSNTVFQQLVEAEALRLDSSVDYSQVVSQAVRRLDAVMAEITQKVTNLGHRIAGDNTKYAALTELLGKSGAELAVNQDAVTTAKLVEQLKKGFVNLVAKNGRLYRYALSYIVSLEAFMARQSLKREVAVQTARSFNTDLVQVSSNPSKQGDFCDLYIGKVFSVSGTHPFYPPLAETPRGGPPFHHWCYHYLTPFLSDELNEQFIGVPDQFRALAQNEAASANDFERLYRKLNG